MRGDVASAREVVVGLDIGGTKVHGVLLVDGAVVAEDRFAVRHGADGVVATATLAVDALAGRLAALVPGAEVGAVGVGVPGLVLPGAGTVAHAVNLGIVEPEPLGARLAGALGVPVTVENDLNVAALGAAHVLGLEGDLALLALGTGVAAGLLLDGRLRRGHRGAAGEVGHVPYAADGPRCACGQVGCLELYASGSAIDAAWPSPDGVPAPAHLFRAAAAGDVDAARVRDRFADAVATAVQTLTLTVDVEHVVLGGGVSEVGEPLLVAVRRALRRREAASSFLATLGLADRVRLAPPGARVAPVGAALAALTGRDAARAPGHAGPLPVRPTTATVA
ncbi:ROK family protein [Actinotalea sp. AC32]|nr:ROK family protein [Actinotalea sp. AC32]